MTVKQKNPGWLESLLKRYGTEAELAVGYPASTEAVGIRYPDGTPLVLVAAVNTFGSASRGIPARPFMREGGPAAIKATEPVAAVMVRAINRGKASKGDALTEMGPFAQAAIQTTITDGAWEPNSPVTVQLKGSSQPLIDTGLMRNSLTWIVRRPGA